MKEFMMIFRSEYNPAYIPSPEELQASIKKWQDWIGGIAAQGKFVGTNRLGTQGRVLRQNQLQTDGPYAETKEIVGGYIIVKAENMNEAHQMGLGCPTLAIGGSVEIRDLLEIPKF